ncbi:MAG: hypothetical protein HYV40_03830 [Candidatus Levybacteria bacterium]|nr:hypothetical protein [Candidatus Levybacteria bacterium]
MTNEAKTTPQLQDGTLPRGEPRAEAPSWFKSPAFALINDPVVIGRRPSSALMAELTRIQLGLFSEYASAVLQELHYPALLLNGDKDASQGKLPRISEKVQSPHLVTINPVFLDRFPQEAYDTMEEVAWVERQREANGEFPLFFDKDLRRPFMHKLRDNLPQAFMPLAITRGRNVVRTLDADNKAKNNFTNMVFTDDTDGIIRNLPFHWGQVLRWGYMGKFGGFKVADVMYENRGGHVIYAIPVLFTLEGGSIALPGNEMIKQLAIYGSSRSIDKSKLLEGVDPIAYEDWVASDAVNGLIHLGELMGQLHLVSPGIEVDDLVSTDQVNDEDAGVLGGLAARFKVKVSGTLTREAVKSVAETSQQAEGAFLQYDRKLRKFVITASGKFGAVKTDLRPNDLVAVEPSMRNHTFIYTLPVEGIDPIGASVEGPEFANPLNELLESTDPALQDFKVRIAVVDGKYIPIGDTEVAEDVEVDILSGIYGIVHIHRDYYEDQIEELVASGEVIEIKLPDKKVLGCGVDLMEEQSMAAILEANRLWNEGGRTAKLGLFRVGRHGLNIFEFAVPDENGEIPSEAHRHLEEMLTRTDSPLKLLPFVRQEHTPIKIFEQAN